jgi:hypothetical protein
VVPASEWPAARPAGFTPAGFFNFTSQWAWLTPIKRRRAARHRIMASGGLGYRDRAAWGCQGRNKMKILFAASTITAVLAISPASAAMMACTSENPAKSVAAGDAFLRACFGGAIDHRLLARPRISEPSGATVTLSGSECGSVVTTSPGSAAAAATEKACLSLSWQCDRLPRHNRQRRRHRRPKAARRLSEA